SRIGRRPCGLLLAFLRPRPRRGPLRREPALPEAQPRYGRTSSAQERDRGGGAGRHRCAAAALELRAALPPDRRERRSTAAPAPDGRRLSARRGGALLRDREGDDAVPRAG